MREEFLGGEKSSHCGLVCSLSGWSAVSWHLQTLKVLPLKPPPWLQRPSFIPLTPQKKNKIWLYYRITTEAPLHSLSWCVLATVAWRKQLQCFHNNGVRWNRMVSKKRQELLQKTRFNTSGYCHFTKYIKQLSTRNWEPLTSDLDPAFCKAAGGLRSKAVVQALIYSILKWLTPYILYNK